jgi:hypothetical protein
MTTDTALLVFVGAFCLLIGFIVGVCFGRVWQLLFHRDETYLAERPERFKALKLPPTTHYD